MSAKRKDKKLYPDQPLPKITPHVFRHTFCTKMAHAGMDIKSLQYLMGHSDAEDSTVTFAGRGAQVGLTHKHNPYTKFTPIYEI